MRPLITPLDYVARWEDEDGSVASVTTAGRRRDRGRCVDCDSRERLEFDHIIPVSKGGSNTARNIELRCEACNRRKSASVLRASRAAP